MDDTNDTNNSKAATTRSSATVDGGDFVDEDCPVEAEEAEAEGSSGGGSGSSSSSSDGRGSILRKCCCCLSCCGCCRFDGARIAQGYNILGMGRGALIMSNIFLVSALTYLASEEVGCTVEEECTEKVYGVFRPASLITNIAVISGVLSALLMPYFGAIIDYTPHRWKVGIVTVILLIAIQIIQIWLTSSTWFYMAILQAISGLFYQIQNLATYAYIPTLAKTVGEEAMTKYMPTFTMVQFSSQGVYLLIVVAISIGAGFNDVETAMFSQAFNSYTVAVCFYCGWKLLPSNVPAKHQLPAGKWILTQGFIQNYNTAKEINQQYKKGLRWFLLSITFAESSATAFTVVSVVFLDEQLGLSGSEIGIFFFLSLIGMIPGGLVAQYAASKTNPKISWCVSMLVLFATAVVGALSLNKDNAFPFSYAWGFVVGSILGWYYPTMGMIQSMLIPSDKEGELTGFFVYCTQILSWLPPLIFSMLVEAGISQAIGVVCISCFFLVAIATMSMAAPWDEMIKEIANSSSSSSNNNNGDDVIIIDPTTKQQEGGGEENITVHTA